AFIKETERWSKVLQLTTSFSLSSRVQRRAVGRGNIRGCKEEEEAEIERLAQGKCCLGLRENDNKQFDLALTSRSSTQHCLKSSISALRLKCCSSKHSLANLAPGKEQPLEQCRQFNRVAERSKPKSGGFTGTECNSLVPVGRMKVGLRWTKDNIQNDIKINHPTQ
ncbi:mCG145021, partial [Mus musculus]